MDAKVKDEIGKILADLDKAGEFIRPATTEETLRDFLASYCGPSWRNAQLQTNALYGRIVYSVAQIMSIDGKQFPIVFVIDRDEQGQFYVAAPSPVAGYE